MLPSLDPRAHFFHSAALFLKLDTYMAYIAENPPYGMCKIVGYCTSAPMSLAGRKGCLKASVAKAWTDFAGVWQEWSLVDLELGAWWRKIEKWEVVYKPPLAGNADMHDTALALVAGERISQRSAYNMESFADEVGRVRGAAHGGGLVLDRGS